MCRRAGRTRRPTTTTTSLPAHRRLSALALHWLASEREGLPHSERLPGSQPCRILTRARLTAATLACRTPTRRTSRCALRSAGFSAQAHALLAQAFMGGLWVVLGLQFCKDVIEVRPLHRHVATSHAALCVRLQKLTAPAPLQPGPRDGDVRGGIQAKAARPRPAVQGQAAGAPPPTPPPRNPIAFAQRPQPLPLRAWPARVRACVCMCVCVARLQLAARWSRLAVADATLQSPIAEDQVLPHTKAPRIVKWKLDRLW